ncbi:hypothetical protein SM192_14960, partial [Lactococcus lactis]|nr:hypothetical protein [Lactococcus lactis]
MKKELMFIFYHMGISKYALGQMYRFLDVSDLMDILQGEYLFYSLNSINFTEKDIDILNMTNKCEGIKHEA